METEEINITEQHKRLFRIMYREGVFHIVQIADRMNLPPTEIQQLSQELEAYLIAKIGKITSARIDTVCPECLLARVYNDPETHERSCTACGFVFPFDVESADYSLPYDTTYAPESSLAVNHSLGGTLQKRDQQTLQRQNGDNSMPLTVFKKMYPLLSPTIEEKGFAFDDENAYLLDNETSTGKQRKRIVRHASLREIAQWVLANKKLCPEDLSKLFHSNDVPLRTRKVRLLSCGENAELDKMLYTAFELSRRFNLANDHIFNNALGNNIRRMYNVSHDYNLRVPKSQLVNTIFYLTLHQQGRHDVIVKADSELRVDNNVIEMNRQLTAFMKQLNGDMAPLQTLQA